MSLRNRLKHQLKDRQFRHAYADEQLNLSIGTQIKVIREAQKMSQSALADKIGTKQTGISRIESANYSGWSIAILRKLAEAFDLRLRVSFEEFGTLWKEVDDFSRTSLERCKFDDDPEFKEPVEEPVPKKAVVAQTGLLKRLAEARGEEVLQLMEQHISQFYPGTTGLMQSRPELIMPKSEVKSNVINIGEYQQRTISDPKERIKHVG